MSNSPKPFLFTLFWFLDPPILLAKAMFGSAPCGWNSQFPPSHWELYFFPPSLFCPWKRNLWSTHGVILVSFTETVGTQNEKQKTENKVYRALWVCFLSMKKCSLLSGHLNCRFGSVIGMLFTLYWVKGNVFWMPSNYSCLCSMMNKSIKSFSCQFSARISVGCICQTLICTLYVNYKLNNAIKHFCHSCKIFTNNFL